MPFKQRGALLDEHLRIWRAVWSATPASYSGTHYAFEDVYMEPKPYRPEGPRLWFGGSGTGPHILRRLTEYGHGFHPFGQPDLEPVREAMTAAGRDFAALEVVGGIRARFPDADRPADLAEAAEQIPAQAEAGYTAICFNPAQYTDDPRAVPRLCRELVSRAT